MAKKNSTKTATKEALQASEPRVLAFRGWTGINIAEAPLGWDYSETDAHSQSDLSNKFFTVQNNLETTDQLAIETRRDDIILAYAPKYIKFTGVVCVHHNWIIAAFDDSSIRYMNILDVDLDSDDLDDMDPWVKIKFPYVNNYHWTEIMSYDGTLICMNEENHIHKGDLNSGTTPDGHLIDQDLSVEPARKVENPTDPPRVTPKGDLVGKTFDSYTELNAWIQSQTATDVNISPQLVSITYCYTNEFGSTLVAESKDLWFAYSPVIWNGGRYVNISGTAPSGVCGIDIYFSTDDSITKTICGHVDLKKSDHTQNWSYNWTGASLDVSQWSMSSINTPVSNTTLGPKAMYCTHINGRLYFWGDNVQPERVYIGGSPGHELSIAIGVGGAFIDIKPGNGNVVNGVCRFKTASGANIVTVLCGNKNTNLVRRYNIIETNITTTNELQSKTYEYEEVSNVIGCNSRYGYAVFEDGLYCLSRWGLGVTTMAMEYNNQMRTAYVSDQIDPVFKDKISVDTQNAHMCCMDGAIYFALGSIDENRLDDVIFCYKLQQKAWYTYTLKRSGRIISPSPLAKDTPLKHIFALDSDKSIEGVGYVREDVLGVIPLTGSMNEEPPYDFECTLMTPELSSRMPITQTHYCCQLELRFDYLVTDYSNPLEIYIEGVDYYGRHFRVDKKVLTKGKVMRQYPVWIRVDKMVESFRIVLHGRVRFRLTHILEKLYAQSSKINLAYGFDDRIGYKDAHGDQGLDHHYLDSYNNYREIIVT